MKFFKLLFILLFTTNINAQKLTKAQVDSLPNTVKNQFIKLYKKSGNYQEYKVVKRTKFIELQKNILDSVSAIKSNILTKQQKIDEQAKTITSLNDKIATLNGDLSTSISKEDSISFLGLQLSKTSYNTILWSIILGLLGGLLFFMYKFNNSNLLTKEAKKNLTEVEEEFEQHRKKAIEKEQKLRRKLQDEINKQRGV